MKTRKVQPFGKLYWGNREYFLVRPEPLPPESWENGLEHRWSVVLNILSEPRSPMLVYQVDNGEVVYPPTCQIVCSNALIELKPDMKEILTEVIEIADSVWDEPTEEIEPSPDELFAISDEVEDELALVGEEA